MINYKDFTTDELVDMHVRAQNILDDLRSVIEERMVLEHYSEFQEELDRNTAVWMKAYDKLPNEYFNLEWCADKIIRKYLPEEVYERDC